MDKFIYKTQRLHTREMTLADRQSLCAILQDAETMYAYEHGFSDNEVDLWLNKQLENYKRDGYGLWAVIHTASGEMIGQCGLTRQQAGEKEVLEIGYLFNRRHWGLGYAAEAARGCRDYAFNELKADSVHSIIRDTNIASMNVAIRNGMTVRERWIKNYYNMNMPHLLFRITKSEFERLHLHG